MLTKYDYDLLKYVDSNDHPTDNIITHALGRGSKARLDALIRDKAIECPYLIRDGGQLGFTDGYVVTDKGYMLMQDYSYNVAFSLKRLWEERCWKLAPIIISIVALVVSILAYCK